LNVKVKGREKEREYRKKTVRTDSPSTSRARVLWGAGVSYPLPLAPPNSPAHHTHPYLLSLKPSGKLAVVLYQGIVHRSEPQTQAPGPDAS
jgi:hypothetical protein